VTSDRYTERARTFAHLAALNEAQVGTLTANRVLRVIVGPDALATRAGRLLVITATNLAARLCDRIDFSLGVTAVTGGARVLLGDDRLNAESLIALATRIWKGGFTASADVSADVVVGIGTVTERVDLGLGVDADGAAVVRRGLAVPIARPEAAITAIITAAIGVAQASKLLYPTVLKGRVDDLVRLELGPFGGPIDPLSPRIFGRPVLAGVGAIGSAFLFALIAADARGDIVLVDPDGVKDRDLVRYVLFDERHLDNSKVDVAAALVRAVGMEADPHQAVLGTYLEEDPGRRLSAELVLSLVDSYEQRRSIARELPHRILNAATADRDLTVSRHHVADGYACLTCLYPTRDIDISRDAVIARDLRLDVAEVRQRLLSKRPLSLDDVRSIAIAQGKDSAAYDEYAGDPLDSFYHRTCGTSAVEIDRAGEVFAPITFLPALAGFLVASALLSESSEHRHFRLDAFDGLRTARRRSLPIRPACELCAVPEIVSAYRAKWPRSR
jgi:molybdopterin/thiamine biosynthesis adenylyltransferase